MKKLLLMVIMFIVLGCSNNIPTYNLNYCKSVKQEISMMKIDSVFPENIKNLSYILNFKGTDWNIYMVTHNLKSNKGFGKYRIEYYVKDSDSTIDDKYYVTTKLNIIKTITKKSK